MCFCVVVLECWIAQTNKQWISWHLLCVLQCSVVLLCWSAKTNKHGSHGIARGGGTVVVLTAWLDPSTRHERQHEDEQRKKQTNVVATKLSGALYVIVEGF